MQGVLHDWREPMCTFTNYRTQGPHALAQPCVPPALPRCTTSCHSWLTIIAHSLDAFSCTRHTDIRDRSQGPYNRCGAHPVGEVGSRRYDVRLLNDGRDDLAVLVTVAVGPRVRHIIATLGTPWANQNQVSPSVLLLRGCGGPWWLAGGGIVVRGLIAVLPALRHVRRRVRARVCNTAPPRRNKGSSERKHERRSCSPGHRWLMSPWPPPHGQCLVSSSGQGGRQRRVASWQSSQSPRVPQFGA